MKVRNMARERLEKGEMSLGVGIRTARTVDIAKMMKTAGYDWLFIDLEHGPMSIDFAATLAVAALDTGISPIVRVPFMQHTMATRVLDSGALGVVMPHVDTPEQAREIVEFALDEFQEFEHDAGTALRIGGGPGQEGRFGIGDGLFDLGFIGERHLGLHLAGIGIEYIALPPRSALHLLAADEVADITHGWSPWNTNGAGPDGFGPIVLVFFTMVTGVAALLPSLLSSIMI